MLLVKNHIMGVMDRTQKLPKNIPNDIVTIADSTIPKDSCVETNESNIVKHVNDQISASANEMKIKLSFSVDRLLSNETKRTETPLQVPQISVNNVRSCGDTGCNNMCACCPYPIISPLTIDQHGAHEFHSTQNPINLLRLYHQNLSNAMSSSTVTFGKLNDGHGLNQDYKTVLRPTPIRANDGGNNNCEVANCAQTFSNVPPPTSPTALRFHHQQQQHHMLLTPPPLPPSTTIDQNTSASLHQYTKVNPNQCFAPKYIAYNFGSSVETAGGVNITAAGNHLRLVNANHVVTSHTLKLPQQMGSNDGGSNSMVLSSSNTTPNNNLSTNNTHNNSSSNIVGSQQTTIPHAGSGGGNGVSSGGGSKRKRSWSRAVFSNLQRKGLEIQFQQQKYITKPDRRKLAARLNLTDAQVKVWFQNRRMKWRHTRENLKSGQEKQVVAVEKKETTAMPVDKLEYSSDSMSSLCMSDNEDENEIDVVE